MKQLSENLRRLLAAAPREFVAHTALAFLPGSPPGRLETPLLVIEPIYALPQRLGDSAPVSAVHLHLRTTSDGSSPLNAALLSSELGSLLSLASGRRVHAPPTVAVRMEGQPTVAHLPIGTALDPALFAPLPPGMLSRAFEMLGRLASLSEDDLEGISAASHLYYGSVLVAGVDARAGYVLLVAALEVLSGLYGTAATEWSGWEESGAWDDLLAEIAVTPQQAARVRHKLLANRQVRLKSRFRRYVTETLPDSFWNEPFEQWVPAIRLPDGRFETSAPVTTVPMDSCLPRDRVVLDAAISRAYDLRSGIVHSGRSAGLFDLSLRSGVPAGPDSPLPYPLLRRVAGALIIHELRSRSAPISLPSALAAR